MSGEEGKNGKWLDEIRELILRKQAENVALRKIQESLQQGRGISGSGSAPLPGEDDISDNADENQ